MALKDKLQKDGSAISQVFRSRNAAVLFGLGFSSGLPLALTGDTLKAWLTQVNMLTPEKISLVTIGIFGMIGIPYSLKLLWAPLLDRFQLPLLGRRRGWILLTQLGLIGALLLLGFFGTSSLGIFAVCAALVAFLSASQDIVVDGYRADLLTTKEVAMGMTVFLLGYRVGMLVSGAGSGFMGDAFETKAAPENWSYVYFIMAGFASLGILATLWAPEPILKERPPSTIAGAFEYPFLAFLRRRSAFLLLAFIFIYKLADTLLLTTTFYLKLGFTLTELALIAKSFGAGVSMTGIAVGGIMTAKLGIRRSLWVGGIVTALANVTFTLLALAGKNYTMLLITIGIDNFCLNVASVPFNCLLVALCDKRFSATQYALLASVSSMGGRLLSGLSGYLAASLGWAVFFSSTVLAAIPGLILLALLPRQSLEIDPVTEERSGRPCPRCSATVMEGISFCDSCGAILSMNSSQEEVLAPILRWCRRGILTAGFLTALIGVLFPVLQFATWGVNRSLPFIVIHFWLLTLHVGLWAWAKLSPDRAVIVGLVLVVFSVLSDLYFRPDLLGYLLPARGLVLLVLLLIMSRAKLAQKMMFDDSTR
jgi:MFS transporter, PAT family, beta-lactamase induction signal transducer AmpG